MAYHICTLSGTPNPDDELFWYWCDSRGGRSECACRVRPGMTNEDIVKQMVANSNWTQSLALTADGVKIICIPHPSTPPGTFPTEVRGTGSAVLTVESIG